MSEHNEDYDDFDDFEGGEDAGCGKGCGQEPMGCGTCDLRYGNRSGGRKFPNGLSIPTFIDYDDTDCPF